MGRLQRKQFRRNGRVLPGDNGDVSSNVEKKLIVIGGLPGAGKTRKRVGEYGDYPQVDMADFHFESVRWDEALQNAMEKVESEFKHSDIVILEGIFKVDSPSMKWVSYIAEKEEWKLEHIYIEADRETCRQRIKDQMAGDMKSHPDDRHYFKQLHTGRLALLDTLCLTDELTPA